MSQVNRNAPRRGTASESRYSIFEFQAEFPDDKTCLEYLVAKLYPAGIYCPTCKRVTKHHRENGRPSYACQYCGHHEHPLKGTIFENSATSLHLWFYAMYLMASTRCGISAKQLERELGVTYKTAHRMFRKIRSLLGQDDGTMFGGEVELDDAYVGGLLKWQSAARRKAQGTKVGTKTHPFASKAQIAGMAERGRDGRSGRVRAKVIDQHITWRERMDDLQIKVLPETTVYTDEAPHYNDISGMYHHGRVNHQQGVYVSGDVHVNTIEGFWSLVKSGIRGAYHSVSTKHLQSYLDEFVFRYNNREATGRGMFEAFLNRIEKASPESSS